MFVINFVNCISYLFILDTRKGYMSSMILSLSARDCSSAEQCRLCGLHTASTFGRTIFSGVWEVSVMRHGSQASDEIEDDLYQYNVE